MNINLDEVLVKCKILDDKKTKSIISLDFGGLIIKGFRIQESGFENEYKEKLWLTPPSYQGGGRYHPMFHLIDKEEWKKLEKKIYEAYREQSKEHFRKRHGLEDADLVDGNPFT